MKNKRLKLFFSSNNMIILYIIFLFSFVVFLRESAFFGAPTVINLMRSGLITLCFGLSEMLVMIGGGIDISFPAIASVAMYVPMYLFDKGILPDNSLLFLLIAISLGLLLGAINGVLVALLKIPSLIATLATSSISAGALTFIFGVRDMTRLPKTFEKLSTLNIFTYVDKSTNISYPLTVFVFVPIILCIVIAVLLRYTMLGRGLFAVGGNLKSATTVGFPTKKLQFLTYIISGLLTSLTAVIYVTLIHTASTTALMGQEMLVVAACVVGGCSLSGGKGSVIGVVLGTLLITLVQNSLNMLGVDTRWQTLAVGMVLLLGVLMTAMQCKIRKVIIKKEGANKC